MGGTACHRPAGLLQVGWSLVRAGRLTALGPGSRATIQSRISMLWGLRRSVEWGPSGGAREGAVAADERAAVAGAGAAAGGLARGPEGDAKLAALACLPCCAETPLSSGAA